MSNKDNKDNDEEEKKKKRVAIVGAGVSGLAAAWHLHTQCKDDIDVQLFESEPRLGGHACTIPIDTGEKSTTVDVDIGFMVYNNTNYPNMTAWFQAMGGVQEEDSDMSLSVSLDEGKTIEWSSDGLNGLFANRKQLFNPKFYGYIRDMARFNTEATQLLELHQDDPRRCGVTMGQYLRQHNYSAGFCTYYLLPMMAATWSASIEDVLLFPAAQLIAFFANHKMLQMVNRPQWKTVTGRSQTYTTRMAEILGDHAHTSTPIESMQKLVNGSLQYELFTSNDTSVGVFDEIIFATHSDVTHKILSASNNGTIDPKSLELLSQIQYADNVVYVHSDPSLMPTRRRAWCSWNCIGKEALISVLPSNNTGNKEKEAMEGASSGFGATVDHDATNKSTEQELEGPDGRMKAVYVTYWLNRLQNLPEGTPDIFVSLNPHVVPNKIHHRVLLAHPQFNHLTQRAREELPQGGQDGIYYCGAWQGHGFHEDGCRSGFEAATALSGVPLPFVKDDKEKNNDDKKDKQLMVLPPPDFTKTTKSTWQKLQHLVYYDLPVAICKPFISYFLKQAITRGKLILKLNDGSCMEFGDGSPCGSDSSPVTLRIFDAWFFVKTALEYDLGLARSYMAGHFVVEKLDQAQDYNPALKKLTAPDESNKVLGDPIGLTRLFLLLIGNRDRPELYTPRKAGGRRQLSNAMTNASGLVISKIGSLWNFLKFKLFMNNSERGGSLKNIHAHYDLSNDLFTTFLDTETLMYSCAIYDAIPRTVGGGLHFRGSLEQAQWRKLDTLLARAQLEPNMVLLDIGFGWGGLSLHAAQKYNCTVVGITLSVEQKALAEKRVKKAGLEHLITFQVCDYRTFARRPENQGKFDRVVSCEMIEAVGHDHLGDFFWAVEQVLSPTGILVMEAITTPEGRYETYLKSTDFINTIIFPGGCCPSLHALIDAAYGNSCLTLEHVSNIGLHYAETLAEWRRRFNAKQDFVCNDLGFDDVFLRVWNYYLTYCEAGFLSQTVNCLILAFARQGCQALVPLSDTRAVVQAPALTEREVKEWLKE